MILYGAAHSICSVGSLDGMKTPKLYTANAKHYMDGGLHIRQLHGCDRANSHAPCICNRTQVYQTKWGYNSVGVKYINITVLVLDLHLRNEGGMKLA